MVFRIDHFAERAVSPIAMVHGLPQEAIWEAIPFVAPVRLSQLILSGGPGRNSRPIDQTCFVEPIGYERIGLLSGALNELSFVRQLLQAGVYNDR